MYYISVSLMLQLSNKLLIRFYILIPNIHSGNFLTRCHKMPRYAASLSITCNNRKIVFLCAYIYFVCVTTLSKYKKRLQKGKIIKE